MADNAPNTVDDEEIEYTEEGDDTNSGRGRPKPAAAQSTSEAEKYLIGLVSDPDVAAILAARKTGRNVRVVDADDFDNSNNSNSNSSSSSVLSKEALDELDPEIRQVVEALTSQISLKLDPITRKVEALEGLAGTMQQKAVNDQIATVAAKYKDFEKYRSAMSQISRTDGAGLGVEELYLIAKARAGDFKFSSPSTHSELPTPTPQRRGMGTRKSTEASAHGRRAFQVNLADALDRSLDKQ